MQRPPTHLPRFRYRPTTVADLTQGLELLPAWLDLEPDLRAALPMLWERLIQAGNLSMMSMEDAALPVRQRIQAWGISMPVSTATVEAFRLDGRPDPHLSRRIYRAMLDGRLPVMTDRELGVANARGELVLFNLHFSMRNDDLGDAYVLGVLNMAHEVFRFGHRGFNLRAMYYEGGVRDEPYVTAAGFPVRPYADPAAQDGLPPERRTLFFGLTREEARASLPGSTARHIFEHQPPLFRFSTSQRRLLWLALFDDSDEHLLQRLDVSVHGLKKLWRGIYERVESRMPDFFGTSAGEDEGKRGPEKRRQVLAHVRQRSEELRPWIEG